MASFLRSKLVARLLLAVAAAAFVVALSAEDVTANGTENEDMGSQSRRRMDQDTNYYSTIPLFECYYDLGGTMDWIRTIVQRYASSDSLDVRLVDIGDSWIKTRAFGASPEIQEMLHDITDGIHTQGFDIYALSITAKAKNTTTTTNITNSTKASPIRKAPFLMVSSTHAREYTPPELIRRWLENLLEKIENNNDDVWSWLEHTELHWVPYLNPDGRVVAETREMWRRKNLNIEWTGDIRESEICLEDSFGVDLNRNFPFEWGDETGASRRACGGTAMGSGPASEPETKALVDYAEAVFPPAQRLQNALTSGDYHVIHDPKLSVEGSSTKWKGFDPTTTQGCFIDVHSTGRLYVYPWGNQNALAPNDASFRSVMGNLQKFTGNVAMGPGPYHYGEASGATDDWAYGVLGAMSMTWELGSFFHEPCELFEQRHQKHFRSFEYLAKIAPFPFALGKGPLIGDINITISSDNSLASTKTTIALYYRSVEEEDDDVFNTTTTTNTKELVRMGSNTENNLGQYLPINIRASLSNVLPKLMDPIEFEGGSESAEEEPPSSISMIRIYHQKNPLVGLLDVGHLDDVDENEFWDLPFSRPNIDEEEEEDLYMVYVSKTQLWEAFGLNEDWTNGSSSIHSLYFQAGDNTGNWGPLTAIRLEILLLEETNEDDDFVFVGEPLTRPSLKSLLLENNGDNSESDPIRHAGFTILLSILVAVSLI